MVRSHLRVHCVVVQVVVIKLQGYSIYGKKRESILVEKQQCRLYIVEVTAAATTSWLGSADRPLVSVVVSILAEGCLAVAGDDISLSSTPHSLCIHHPWSHSALALVLPHMRTDSEPSSLLIAGPRDWLLTS